MEAAESHRTEQCPHCNGTGRIARTIGPVPLTIAQATEQCLHLRQIGWAWTAIAKCMRDYHGIDAVAATWRQRALTMAPYYGVDASRLKLELTPNKRAALRRLQKQNIQQRKLHAAP